MDKVTKPKPAPGRQRYLTTEERITLLAEVQNSRCPVLYPIVVLALSTGMRRGEIMKLTLGDIDLNNQTIRLEMTKNGRPRLIPLKGLAHRLVSSNIGERKDPRPTDLLFPSPNNPQQPYDIQTDGISAPKSVNALSSDKEYPLHLI